MTPNLEAQAIANVAAGYRNRGYQVEIAPTGAALPAFLRGFQPDLIARRPDDNVVVEVKIGTRTSVAERLHEVAERINREPGWRFSVVFADPDRPGYVTEGETTPFVLLEQRVQNAHQLIETRQNEAAFLLLWSALEGLLRHIGERAQLPLTSLPPSALLRELYSAGELSRDNFDALMRLLPIRNKLVHGFGQDEGIDTEELEAIVNSLLADFHDAA